LWLINYKLLANLVHMTGRVLHNYTRLHRVCPSIAPVP